jgi:hypothetical protein
VPVAETIDFSAGFMLVDEESRRLMSLQIPGQILNSMVTTIAIQSTKSIEVAVRMD